MAPHMSGRTSDFTNAAALFAPSGKQATEVACFHCGTLCRGATFALEDKAFCCQGCRTVFEILAANGLTEFYKLSENAGVRIAATAKNEQFQFLDEPALRERLVDFSDATLTRVTFQLPTIHCIACVWLLENLFQLQPGIGQTQVNFPRKEAAISFDPARVKLSAVVTLLASLGYEPELKLSDLEGRPQVRVARRLWIQLGLAGFAFGNIMLFSISSYLGLDAFAGPGFAKMVGLISLLLATPVVVYSAAEYWRAAWRSLQQKLLNIDVPIAAGVAAIYLQSVYEVLTGRGEGYFDSLCGLIFFLLCGRLFQQKTYDRLAFDRDYKSFFPLSVTRRKSEIQNPKSEIGEEQVSLSQLAVGDRLIIRNGELIPADAKLINGPALIDYSFVTGESEPVEKKADDYLYAGGRQLGGAIEVAMVKAVSQSYLTSLWNQEAFRKEKHLLLDQITNAYSQRFTKIVIAIALGAATFWAFVNPALVVKSFTSVLIVACPCALALAAPFTLGAAQRMLARRNIYLKNPYVLETLAEVDAVVFDKTGTLTAAGAGSVKWIGSLPALTPALSPRERVKRSQPSDEVSVVNGSQNLRSTEARQLLSPLPGGEGQGEGEPLTETEERWLFSMTRHSTHPLPVRIGEAIKRNYFPEPVRSFLETPGCGMEGSVAGHEIWMGSAAWLESREVAVESSSSSFSSSSSTQNNDSRTRTKTTTRKNEGSVVHVAIDGNYRGHFVLASAVRPETEQLAAGLSSRCEVALLSGDNEKERDKFAALLGPKAQLHFHQSPLDKLNFIKHRQQAGRTVLMVGDGLNDAGALRQADVGVAVVENISAFSPASDAIFAAGMVTRTAAVLRYSRQSLRVVRVAFWISAAYNAVGIAIAASGKLSPVVCAILMPVSSVTVVAFACGAATWLARRNFNRTEVRS
jgi:Cu+-exporting ATPase